VAALNGGYHAAFLLSAIFVALATVLAAALLKLDKNGKDIGGIPADAATNDGKTPGES
jgi:hypothetical protein